MDVAGTTRTHASVMMVGMDLCVISPSVQFLASMDFAMLLLQPTRPTTVSVIPGGGVKLVINAVHTGNAPIR